MWFFKKPRDVSLYAKTKAKAKSDWRKYKETHKEKYRDSANRRFATLEALKIKMGATQVSVRSKSYNVHDNFKNSVTGVSFAPKFSRTKRPNTKKKR